MTWVKRNLVLLVGGLVFVMAVLGSLLMLKNQILERENVGTELETQIKELERLTSLANFPDPGNVKDMQQDNNQMEERITQLLRQFTKAQVPTEQITGIKFRELMNKRTQDLSRLARQQGISIPSETEYLFGFERYEKTIPDNEFVPLLIKQLNVIEEITTLMFKSPRNLQLLEISRVEIEDAGSDEERRGRQGEPIDMPNNFKGVQNDPAKMYTVMPFNIRFTADPEGLRSFLNNLTHSKYLLIPQFVNIECDEKKVEGSVLKAEVTPEGEVITPLPEAALLAEETTKFVLGQRTINITMKLDWVEFRQPEAKEKRKPREGAAPAADAAAAAPAGAPAGAPAPAGSTPPAGGAPQ